MSSLLRRRIEAFGLSSFNRNVSRSRESLLLIHSLLHHPESTYRASVLHRNKHQDLPLDFELIRSETLASLQRWKEFGEGFTGHGFPERGDGDHVTSLAKTAAEIEAQKPRTVITSKRPEWIDITNWAYWRSRFRPELPIAFYLPRALERGWGQDGWYSRIRTRVSTVLGYAQSTSTEQTTTTRNQKG